MRRIPGNRLTPLPDRYLSLFGVEAEPCPDCGGQIVFLPRPRRAGEPARAAAGACDKCGRLWEVDGEQA